jgi:hypothetical protein
MPITRRRRVLFPPFGRGGVWRAAAHLTALATSEDNSSHTAKIQSGRTRFHPHPPSEKKFFPS